LPIAQLQQNFMYIENMTTSPILLIGDNKPQLYARIKWISQIFMALNAFDLLDLYFLDHIIITYISERF
jgi:hypothetical protein